MDAHELEQTLLNPNTRNIAQITVSDKNKSNDVIKIFMGKETNERKEYIAKHSEEAKV